MTLSKPIFISLLVHAVLIAALAFNYQFSNVELKQTSHGKPIKARSVNAKNIERLVNKIKQKDIDKKKKEVERLRKLKAEEEKIRKNRIEEENKTKKAKQRRAEAERKRKNEEKKAEDAKKKRVADDKARKKKVAAEKKLAAKRKADAEKKRKAEAERKRKAKIAEEKRKKDEERKKKLAEEKAAQEALEKEMQRQMDAEAEALNAAKHQQVMTEVDKFVSLIQGKIKRNWLEPENIGYCIFRISLAPGGLVIGVSVLEGDKQHCDSGQRAIYKAEPLPVSNDPDVFAELRAIRLTLGESGQNVQ